MALRIAIVGYGRMGRMVDRLAGDHQCEVVLRIPSANELVAANLEGVDVAIEFTEPSAVASNVQRIVSQGVPIVVGTTGWLDEMDSVKNIVDEHQGSLVWSPNFSIGMNVFFRVVSEAARLLAAQPQYGAHGWEIHHDQKRDAPSGTLNQLAAELHNAGYARPISLAANRAGFHPGTHEIGFDSPEDTILLSHVARSRDGFAVGALRAAHLLTARSRDGQRGFFAFHELLWQS